MKKYTRVGELKAYGYLAFFAIAASALSGCIGYDTISNEVRPGGTVMVAVDDVRNRMPKANEFVATFTEDAGSVHDVSVRFLLRVQPDPTSDYGIGIEDGRKGAYVGEMLAIVDIIDPATGLPPAGIASGSGELTLVFPDGSGGSNTTVHGLTILPLGASPAPALNNFRIYNDTNQTSAGSGWLTETAAPNPHVLIETVPDVTYGNSNEPRIAAAKFEFSYLNSDFSTVAVAKLTSDPNLQLAWKVENNGSDSTLSIFLTNPHGFHFVDDSPSPIGDKSVFDDLSSIAIVFNDSLYEPSDPDPFTLVGSTYYDIDGNEVTGIAIEWERR